MFAHSRHPVDGNCEVRKPLSLLHHGTSPAYLSLCEALAALSYIKCGPSSQGTKGLVRDGRTKKTDQSTKDEPRWQPELKGELKAPGQDHFEHQLCLVSSVYLKSGWGSETL